MTQKSKRPAPVAAGRGAETEHEQALTAKRTTSRRASRYFWTKRRRVLLYLSRGNSLNRFEAVSKLHDWVLPSTVSDIQSVDGIEVMRRYESVRGFMGHATWVSRYSLSDTEAVRAREKLATDLYVAGLAESHEEALRFVSSGLAEAA